MSIQNKQPALKVPDTCLKEAYALLCRVTPFRFDCGKLCNSACCRDGLIGKKTGMTLFFGEESLLTAVRGFDILGDERKLLVCSGRCDRSTRPLACRMFPFYPYLREENGVTRVDVVRDPRAFGMCPAAYLGLKPEYEFARSVRKAARWLLHHDENARIIRETNALFDELENIRELMKDGTQK
ncbi:MAG: hypothetical protein FWF05_08115 [Oscillospiraceae bacterium]|nr:hypothetical protein [Oscillospiraceae bacterium]